jgi:hypothetical protein
MRLVERNMASESLAVQPSHSEIHRAGCLKWLHAPPGMSPELADDFMNELKAGKTVRSLTSGIRKYGPAMVTFERFKMPDEPGMGSGSYAAREGQRESR